MFLCNLFALAGLPLWGFQGFYTVVGLYIKNLMLKSFSIFMYLRKEDKNSYSCMNQFCVINNVYVVKLCSYCWTFI